MVAPVPHTGIAHVLGQRVDLRHLRHRPMERAVETSHLRQAGERFSQRAGSQHVVGLVRRFHNHKRVEIIQHVALDPHRCLEAGAAEYDTVAGGYHLPVTQIGFQPSDDEVQRCFVVDRVVFAPFMHAQLLAGRVL